MSPQVAANIAWPVWYSTWMAAVVLSARTQTQMKTDMTGWHRVFAGLGVVLLFIPAVGPHAEREFWALARTRLWPSVAGVDWTLFGLTLAGFAFCWWARLHLGRLWSGFVTLKEGHRVVDTGPYALVRHPIYSGVIVSALATAAMRATPAALVGAVLVALGFGMTARIEEGFLREQLGAEAYDDYSRRVGMLIPKVG